MDYWKRMIFLANKQQIVKEYVSDLNYRNQNQWLRLRFSLQRKYSQWYGLHKWGSDYQWNLFTGHSTQRKVWLKNDEFEIKLQDWFKLTLEFLWRKRLQIDIISE